MWSFILMNNIKLKKIREIHLKNVDFIFEKIFVSRLAEYDYVVIIRGKKIIFKGKQYLSLFVWGFFVPLSSFSLVRRPHHYR